MSVLQKEWVVREKNREGDIYVLSDPIFRIKNRRLPELANSEVFCK
jgi:hypothetical protein